MKASKHTFPVIGGHVSAAGGIQNSVQNGLDIGAEVIQIFGASPRQWSAREPSKAAYAEFKKKFSLSKLHSVFLHAPYLINLGSPDGNIYEKSVRCLSLHLSIAENIGATGLIFHPGSGKEITKEKTLAQIAKGVRAVLANVPGNAKIIIENTAGGGTKTGATLDEIAVLLSLSKNARVGVCFDTAHAFESGLLPKFNPKNIASLFDEFDKTIGIANLLAIHANDSMTESFSYHDRHENIGRGKIGIRGFRALAHEKRLKKIPWILEVPGMKNMGPDRENINILKKCFS